MDLYDKTRKIIFAKTTEEAEKLLFGEEGIKINSNEYYQIIISNFVKKKEFLLPKVGCNIIFDLDENINSLCDIMFISQYIQEQWNKEIKVLDAQKDKLKEIKNDSVKSNLKNKINDFKRRIYDYVQNLTKKDNLNKVIINFKNIDKVKYNDFLVELKKAILIIDKLRNSFEHQNDKLEIDKIVKIDNEKNKFAALIPLEYLDGFNKGKIIVKVDDKDILIKTYRVLFPLLNELNYDLKKTTSFFYNIEPNYLLFLLESFDYNFNKIYQLSGAAFYYPDATKKIIEYLKNINSGLDMLEKLPGAAFDHPDETIKIIEYLKNVNNGLDILEKLPGAAFYYPDATKKIIEYLKNINSGLDMLEKLPGAAFYNPDETKKIIEYLKDKNNVLDILEKLPDVAFYHSDKSIKIIESLKDVNNGLEFTSILKKLPDAAFYNPDKPIKIIEYLKDENNGLEFTSILEKLPDVAFNYPDETIKIIEYLKDENNGLDILDKLPGAAFYHPDETIKIIESLKDKNNVLDILEKLPDAAFYHSDATKKTIESLKDVNNGLDILEKLPFVAFYHSDKSIKIIEYLKDKNNVLDILEKLPFAAFYNPDKPIKIIEYLKDENNGLEFTSILEKLPDAAFYNPDKPIKIIEYLKDVNNGLEFTSILEKLPDVAFNYPDATIKIIEYLKDVNNGLDILDKLPGAAFYHPDETIKIIEYLKDVNNGLDILDKLPGAVFRRLKSLVNCLKNSISPEEIINIVKIVPEKVIEEINVFEEIKVKNLKYLLELVNGNYERLEEFPVEFFLCDFDFLIEMVSKYHSNVCKSIFGIKEPKVIALLIYMNSVFGGYSNKMAEGIDINIEDVIVSSVRNTYTYKNNITDVDLNIISYIDQFIVAEELPRKNSSIDVYDEKGVPMSYYSKLKDYFIRKLRNSSAHFRFKLVKDENGNIVEDKIYLYDENRNVNNFNIILDLSVALEITRQVEEEMVNFKNIINSGRKK